MADDDSRSEDAEKRPGKSSKPSKRPSKSEDAKAKAGKKSDKKSDKADDDAKSDKVEKSEKGKTVKTAAKSEAKDDKPKKKPGLLRRFGIFIREIFEQLRKVVYPTRKQLLTYTAVVLVFVTIMIGVIYGLDYVMSKGVMWVFGGNDK